jgi:hypothetical protein
MEVEAHPGASVRNSHGGEGEGGETGEQLFFHNGKFDAARSKLFMSLQSGLISSIRSTYDGFPGE